MHHSSDGPVAYVDSPCGHLVIHEFHTARSMPADRGSPAAETPSRVSPARVSPSPESPACVSTESVA